MWEQRSPRDITARMLHGVFESDVARPRGERAPALGADPTGQGSVAGEEADSESLGVGDRRAFPLAAFQEVGVRRLQRILRDRGGAILADAVGLGKTYVALALIEEALQAGSEVVVVVPAALRATWNVPLQRLCRRANQGDSSGPVAVRLASHAQLSRGASFPVSGRSRMVIVDEAHQFRNPATRRYRALARLVHGGTVLAPPAALLLLTATPVNNSVVDLYHLARLFLPDDGLRDAGVPSLRAAFLGEAPSVAAGSPRAGAAMGADPRAVRAVVREVVVRRSRRMVEDRFPTAAIGTNVRFPARAPVAAVTYADPGMPGRVRRIKSLELQAYGPGAAPLLRLGLLKRMDSSRLAFQRSLLRLRILLEDIAEAAERGRLLRPGSRHVGDDGDPLQRILPGILAERASPDVDLEKLAASARRDRELVAALAAEKRSSDGKAAALESMLDGLDGEKVVVFTEYRDTAEDLWRGLGHRFRIGRVDGSGAWLGRHPASRAVVVHRFAPVSNRRRAPPERERIDVLIATDVLSEGLNLQDARHVVGYDLPWNPVRLLQRIGRIDRLGSPHDLVFAHVFIPDRGLDEVLGLTRALRRKLDGIAASVGLEAADDLLDGLVRRRPAQVERALAAAAGDESDPWESLRTLWLRHTGVRRNRACPYGGANSWIGEVRVPRGSVEDDIACVALVSLGTRLQLLQLDRGGAVGPVGRRAQAVLESAIAGGDADPGANAGPGVKLDARGREARSRVLKYLDGQIVASRAPAPLGPRAAGARLARRVRASLGQAGSRTGPQQIRKAEAVLRLLARPLSPALEADVDAFLDRARTAEYEIGQLLSVAEELLLRGTDARGADGCHPLSRYEDPGARGSDYGSQHGASPPRIHALLLVTSGPESAEIELQSGGSGGAHPTA